MNLKKQSIEQTATNYKEKNKHCNASTKKIDHEKGCSKKACVRGSDHIGVQHSNSRGWKIPSVTHF